MVVACSLPGDRKKKKLSPVSYRVLTTRTNQMLLVYWYTGVRTAALLYCCSGLVGG